MKIVSLNVRELRDWVKRKLLRSLLSKCKGDNIMLQETKIEDMTNNGTREVQGENFLKCELVALAAKGFSGGLLTIWKKGLFSVIYTFEGYGFLGFDLQCTNDNKIIVTVNVYSPCLFLGKRKLWGELVMFKRDFGSGCGA